MPFCDIFIMLQHVAIILHNVQPMFILIFCAMQHNQYSHLAGVQHVSLSLLKLKIDNLNVWEHWFSQPWGHLNSTSGNTIWQFQNWKDDHSSFEIWEVVQLPPGLKTGVTPNFSSVIWLAEFQYLWGSGYGCQAQTLRARHHPQWINRCAHCLVLLQL